MTSARVPGFALLVLSSIALAAAAAQTLSAQLPTVPANVAPVVAQPLRRIYVPADEMADEIRGLTPMKRDEFERRTATLKPVPAELPAEMPPSVTISDATYRATIRGDQMIAGTSELNVELQTSVEAVSTLHWLPLAPCSLPLGTPTWKVGDGQGVGESATWGVSDKQQLLVAVSRSGKLLFPWSLRGRKDERGRVRFEFDLPAAARQRLELRLPANSLLTSETSMIRERGAVPPENGSKPSDALPESLWEVEVASGRRVELLVEPRKREEQLQPLALVRETSSYVFTPGQMDLDLSLELDIDRAPLRQIRVRHDPRLNWTAIRWGEQTLAWTTEKSSSDEPVAVIQLPEPLTGNSRLIQLTAVADWTPLPQKWALPRVTVENAIWQEGRANVAAPRWLQLDAIAGPGSRLTATTLASDNQGTDLLQFQLERNSASIEVQPAISSQPLDCLSMLTLQVEPKQLVAQFAAELTVTSGSHFTIECEVPRSWVIDSLETVPADLLEDRTVKPRNNFQSILLQLRQPLRTGRPLRIQARLRHVRGPGAEAWNDDILQPVRFLTAATQQRYVTLQLADASFEPRLLSADGLEFLSPSVLPPRARALVDSTIGSWLVRLTDAARQPRFLLAPGSPRYAGESTLQTYLSPGHVDYRLSIRCEPESSAVSNLLVQIRPAPAVDPQWRLDSEPRPLIAERVETMVTASDQPGPALYRIELPRARDVSFALNAQWNEAIVAPTFAPMIELPEATSHAAQVELIGLLDTPMTWQAERLRPLPIPPTAAQVRARYRYQAGQDARLKLIPLLETLRPLAGWISRCEIESWFAPTGAGRHEAHYVVAGGDVETLELRLAENARLARAVVDGREVLAFSRTSDPRWLSIPLRNPGNPIANANPLVRLEYTSPPLEQRAWIRSRWTAPIPETRLPVLQSYWHAYLPNNWQLWPSTQVNSSGQTATARSSSFLALMLPGDGVASISRDLPSSGQVQIDVYSPTWFGLLALAVALASTAAVLYFRNWSAFTLIAVSIGWLALAIFVSPPMTVFIQAALAGWLTGCALQLFRSTLKVKTIPAAATTSTQLLQPIARLLFSVVILGTIIGAGTSWNLLPSLQAADESERPWRVVIPIDDDRQPVGDYVYVSPALWEALFRQSPQAGAGQPDWLIRSAQYDLRWQTSGADLTTEFQGIVARYEIEVFRPGSTFKLPFSREQVRLTDPGVRMDGEAAAATWSAASDALLIELDSQRTGRQRIEVGLALLVPPRDGTIGASIRIPAVQSSRVVVPLLASTDKVSIPTARGGEHPADGAAWQVELGAADQLTVQWSRSQTEPPPVIEAEQLLLWRLRPSSVVVEGKWQFRPLTGKLREVVIRADPRFRLLPIGNGSNIVKQWLEEGEVNLHHFVLDRATTADVSLTASFLLVGSTGIGNLIPPRIEAAADRVTRDWQAAWTAPGLQWNGKTGSIPAAEFLQQWGDQSLSPVQAYRSTPESPRPALAVSPVQNRLQAIQQIEWSLTPDQTSVRYRLQGQTASASLNQLRFVLMPQLTVRRVVVTQGDVSVASRWFRHADGLLTLLLDEVRAEPWQVEVLADRPHIAGKTANLPVLQVTDVDVQQYECQIRRRAGADAKLGKLSGWKQRPVTVDPKEAEDDDANSGDRLIAELEWNSTRPGTIPSQIAVTLGASLPGSAGELLTRLLPVADGWQVEVIANLSAPGSNFDELQFSVPRDWTGLLEMEPAGRWHLELLPGQSRNLLRVQLQTPVKDKLHLRLTAPLETEQELIRLPAVDLVGTHELQRWVSLPQQASDSKLQWQTAGLQLRPGLPADFANEQAQTNLNYEAIIDRYRASARPERTKREQPRVILADHQVAWQNDRRVVGRSELTIVPGGAKRLLIQPPEAHELVAVVVNNIPGQLHREPGIGGAATVELHSDSWPQWVQVIYRGRLPVQDEAAGKWQFAAPQVATAPVERTRWQITGPALLVSPAALFQGKPLDDNDPLASLEALAKVARGATDSPSGHLAESVDTWLRLWRQHWDRELQAIRKRPPSSPLAPVVSARLQALENEMADLLTLPLEDVATIDAKTSVDLVPITSVHEAVVSRPLFELRHTQAGDMPTWTVSLPAPSEQPANYYHWLLAAALLVFAGIVTQMGRSVALRDWIIAFPQLVLALFGVAALMLPGYLWLGVLILLLTLPAAFHSPWRQRA
ncbi:hypothetical protein ETAA8_19630 [Anatilimnocola aggregata]|uniref:Uncharacterized protein n=1 Tax=Anatilimnocola aggregata TaxID=2528021 RepID=A0A517Y9H0_9BACT|nr:hypothetical protein [Anatilimnocola aggregata]QDU26879.1 hypothetical protein ETAA8_19630 [Anatilimnocola aggregata]